MCRRYIDIFYSTTLTLQQRCRSASYVCNFLRIWRLSIFKNNDGDYTLEKHFISRQAFLDVTLSCYDVVLKIMAFRDRGHLHPVAL
jgi:hypothetical protein